MNLYFHPDGERCYPLSIHLSEAREDGLTEVELYEAVPARNDSFYCRAHQEVWEKGDCGKHCCEYSPCNGKSGRCRHMGKAYTIGEKRVFKVK